MLVLYVDILIILNLFIDYFLLLSSAVLLKQNIKRLRLIFAAILGSLSSLFIFLPTLHPIVTVFIKLMIGFCLVLVAFGYKSKIIFIKTVLLFFAENLIFIGVMFCLWMFVSPPGMLWKNGITYIAISPIILIVGSIIAYFSTCLINFIISKRVESNKIYSIKIELDDKVVKIKALYDTGNCLTEPFSGKPVCVCEYDSIFKILPQNIDMFLNNSFNDMNYLNDFKPDVNVILVPCDTVTGCGILPAFLPKNVVVLCNDMEYSYECYVAVTTNRMSDGEYNAIIGDFK